MLKPLALIARDATLRMILILLFVYGGAFSAIAPYQALIAIEIFDLPNWAWSIVLLTGALITLAASVTFGIVTDQFDNRRIAAALCVCLTLLGGLSVWLVDHWLAFLATHMLLWPAGGALFGQLFALARLAARNFPEAERVQVVSAMRALFALSFVVALPFWSATFAAGVSLVIIYPVVVLLAAVNLIVIKVLWTPNATRALQAEKSGLTFLAALQEVASPPILLRVILLATIMAANVLYMTMMGLLFSAAPGRETSDAALFLMCVTAMEVPFMLAAGGWVTRYGQVKLITLGGVFYAAFLTLFVPLIPTSFVWFMALPAAFGAALLLSVPITYLQDLLAHRPGAGGSLPAVTQVIGFAIAATIFAIGTALDGYHTTALLGATATASAACALGLVEFRAGNWPRGARVQT